MSDASDFLENGIINYFFRPNIAAPTRPTTIYLAAFSDDGPLEDGTGGTELAGSGYGRVLVHNNTGTTALLGAPAQVADAAESVNTADIAFPANSGGASYDIRSLALVTTASGAFTLITKKVLSTVVTVQPGQAGRVLAGAMIIRVR